MTSLGSLMYAIPYKNNGLSTRSLRFNTLLRAHSGARTYCHRLAHPWCEHGEIEEEGIGRDAAGRGAARRALSWRLRPSACASCLGAAAAFRFRRRRGCLCL